MRSCCRYDTGNKGYLGHEDLKQVLQALGLLTSSSDRDQYVQSQMLLATADGQHMSFAEFSNYYSSLQFAGADAAKVAVTILCAKPCAMHKCRLH